MRNHVLRSLTLLIAILVGAVAVAQQDDVFDFIPDGGRTLLEGLLGEGLPDAIAARVGSDSADAAQWRAALDEAAGASPAIGALDEWQRETLAQYLAIRAPFSLEQDLPEDGRDLSLALCQSCHIITVVITQERTSEAWLGTMNSPSHIEIESSPEDRRLIAEYLVINAGIPIDLVPPELRAGGASY